ncbi:SpvB/TcaC N-terminal domain-containing protein [Flavobacterium soli]|uniref:SpvB/TcaC N-terminal domain-containing protein n=1 Tax=Flavobacterium soli TaxID=344881 RepID=UPI0004018284|nr:SpvB/TcaC N-terminal domain-containing protein [Flavobacterium soli]
MQFSNPINKKNTLLKKIVYKVMLHSMLYSSFVAPVQELVYAYFTQEEGLRYTGLRSAENENSQTAGSTHQDREAVQDTTKAENKPLLESGSSIAGKAVMTADIEHGFIGVTNERPLDDVSDNIFKVMVKDMPEEQARAYLTYELYGLQDYAGVTRSINDRLSIGGHMIKNQPGWTMQREEIDPAWLRTGENRIMFSIPQGANLQYQVRNLRIEFDRKDSAVLPILTTTAPMISYTKDNKLYVKGFLRNTVSRDAHIYIENSEISLNDGEFEGFLELTPEVRQRKFAIIRAVDGSGLLGQEIIHFENLMEADRLFSLERYLEKVSGIMDAKGGMLQTEGASITIRDSAFLESKEISITHLRRKDVAPMASGMVNVTRGGSAYRFLPDGTSFNRTASIAIGYDERLIPKGYSAKDIKTFYFNTHSKIWVAVQLDTLQQKEQMVLSLTDHFTDYINGIIQTPESPETAGFTPTMMSNIQAADPSSEMTLISPPGVSQKGAANISYPIKIPSGRNGMQPNLALHYNSDGGSGWLGQGWSINIPAISMDTRWGVPEINNTHETVIYTLGGEQLMYPQLKNSEDVWVDWMPHRHYDATSVLPSTDPRLKIVGSPSTVFTPRKQGSFAKIERMGSTPTTYYWKVTNTDGTISWYGGKTQAEINYVLRQGTGAATENIVYWALFMTEDVHGNNIKYSYSNGTLAQASTGNLAPLAGGRMFNISKINYTGHNNSVGMYEIEFKRTSATSLTIRKDPTIDARLGLKLIDPCKLEEIIIRRTGSTQIRKYKFNLKEGEFQKSLLEYVAEFNATNVEFYRHTFDYHNDVRNPGDQSVTLFEKPYFVDLPKRRNPSPNFSLGIGNILGNSALNTNEAIEAGWGLNVSAGVQFKLWKADNDNYATVTVNLPLGESFPKDKGYVTMADINGDGLDDIIYKASSGLKYFASYRDQESGMVKYEDDQRNIGGVTMFSRSKGKTKTMFLESHNLKLQIPFSKKEFFYGRFRTKSEMETDIFFTDGNGDGLLDIVKDKLVLFNQADTNGNGRNFTTSSANTPNMLRTASVNDIPDIVHPEDDGITDAQGFDAVRVWIAPKDGQISITDDLQLVSTNVDSATYYSIETSKPSLNGGDPFRLYLTQLTHANPNPASFTITHYSGLGNPSLGLQNSSLLQVDRGQKIFFRITKNATDINDEVVTNPTIAYLNETDANLLKDENLVAHTTSPFNDGFILSEEQLFEIGDSGNLLITWNDILTSSVLSNPNYLSDGVLFSIILVTDAGEEEIYTRYMGAGVNGVISATANQSGGQNFMTPTQQAIPYPIVVDGSKGEKKFIRFEVSSPSNVKWKGIQWKPRVEFIPASSNSTALAKVRYPVAKYSIYKTNMLRKLEPVTGWTTGTAPVSYGIKPNLVTLAPGDQGSFEMIVKKNGVVVGRKTVTVNLNGTMQATNVNTPIALSGLINLSTPASQFHYSVGYYITNKADEKVFQKYLAAANYKTAIIGYDWTAPANSTKYLPILVESNFNNMEHLGPLHKEWGQFFYNDELDKSTTIPFDAIGKLINPNIGNRYDTLENLFGDGVVDPDSPCLTNTGLTEEEKKDCLANEYIETLGLPEDNPAFPSGIDPSLLDGIELDYYTQEQEDALVTPLIMSRAARSYPNQNGVPTEVEKWTGLFDTQYVMATKMRSGSFAGSSFDMIFPDDEPGGVELVDDFSGMYAIDRKRHSVSVTKTVGWGPVNLSRSNNGNYSHSVSDFIDINGDSYPDLLSSNKVQLTKMTGGHRPLPLEDHDFGHPSASSNFATRLVAQGGSQDLGRKEGPKSKPENPSLTDKTADTNANQPGPPATAPPSKDEAAMAKKDQGNPAFIMNMGADVNLDAENKEQALWLDLNGDGLPDRIVSGDGFRFRLNTGPKTPNTLLGYSMLDTSSNKPTALGFNMMVGLSVNSLFGQAPLPSENQPEQDSQTPEDTDWSSLNIDFSVGLSNSGATTKSTLLDMNGDGLPDLLSVDEGEGNLYINNGNGFSSTPLPLKTTSTGNFTMVEDSNTNAMSIGGEVGLYFYKTTICCTFPFFILPILHFKLGASVSGNASLALTNSHKAFKDFNGDGYVDYVQRVGNQLEVFESKIGRTNKLRTVTNPLKGSFTIDYEFQKTDYSNPHPKWVMSEVRVNDGYGRENNGRSQYVQRFAYENGNYDRRERSFYGYGTVKAQNVVLGGIDGNEVEEIVSTSVAKYHNSSYFLDGLLKESYVIKGDDDAKKFSRTEYFYQVRKLKDSNTKMTTTVLSQAFDTGGTEGRGSAAVVMTRTRNYFHELSATPLLTSEVNFTYDDYGRVLTRQDLGNISNAADNYTTTIAYGHTALVSKHILNVPSSITVGIPGMIRKRTTTVDSNNGNVLAVNSYLTSTQFVSTTMLYDVYGNLTKKTFPPNSSTSNDAMSYTYTYDGNFYKIIKVEDAFGYISETSYTATPANNYFYDNDKVIASTDIAGNKTLFKYDSFGRLIEVRGPKENLSTLPPTISFAYYLKYTQLPTGSGFSTGNANDFVPVAVSSHYDSQQIPANFIETYTFIDGLARPMQIKKDIARNIGTPQSPTYQEYLSVSGWTSYDALGRTVAQHLPHLEQKLNVSKFMVNEMQTSMAAETQYDAIGRPLFVKDADLNVTEIAYSIAQDVSNAMALKTKTIVANAPENIVSETYKDVNGRVISTMNEGPNSSYLWTRFTYNAIGELLSYTDAGALQTVYQYDWLGRKTSVIHPDKGRTRYFYDNASNLTRIQTANLEVDGTFIDYSYERNRLTDITYPNVPNGANVSNVKYSYGAATLTGADANKRGRLVQQKDATGLQEFNYGNMGELVYSKRTIAAPNIPTRIFETAFEYDSWNRLLFMIYPDGEKVNYYYDLGGNLNKVEGKDQYITRIDYDHFEQRTYMRYGNNTETFYTYTPKMRRLSSLNVKTADQQSLFNNVYGYDQVGNVTGVNNTAGSTSNNMGGTYSHAYTYDRLNRLSTGTGSFNGSTAVGGYDHQSNYTLSMDYNSTHGIVNKVQNHVLNNNLNADTNAAYSYFENTHRVQNIADSGSGTVENFTYDYNGNLKTKMIAGYSSSTSYLWDESNRLRVALLSRSMHHYLYDAGGERVLKGSSNFDEVYENGMLVYPSTFTFNGYTTYPSAFMVIDPNGIYSNHYYAGSQRIVSRLGEEKADVFNENPMKTSATDAEPGTEETAAFDDEELRERQIADLQLYLTGAGAGTATFDDYNPSTYEEEELVLQQEAKEEGEGTPSLQERAAAAIAPVYFYHPDHLGTSTFLTDLNGVAYQFFLNLPFGEIVALVEIQ